MKLRYFKVEINEKRSNKNEVSHKKAHWVKDGIGANFIKNGWVQAKISMKMWLSNAIKSPSDENFEDFLRQKIELKNQTRLNFYEKLRMNFTVILV